MNRLRKRKLIIVLSSLILIALGVTFVLVSLSENINLFMTPTQIVSGEAPKGKTIRVGGLVVAGSLTRGTGTQVSFNVTDTANEIIVNFDGILPDLFLEGQSVVVTGQTDGSRELTASEVLAKHDENYIPSEAAEAIMRAQQARTQKQSETNNVGYSVTGKKTDN